MKKLLFGLGAVAAVVTPVVAVVSCGSSNDSKSNSKGDVLVAQDNKAVVAAAKAAMTQLSTDAAALTHTTLKPLATTFVTAVQATVTALEAVATAADNLDDHFGEEDSVVTPLETALDNAHKAAQDAANKAEEAGLAFDAEYNKVISDKATVDADFDAAADAADLVFAANQILATLYA